METYEYKEEVKPKTFFQRNILLLMYWVVFLIRILFKNINKTIADLLLVPMMIIAIVLIFQIRGKMKKLEKEFTISKSQNLNN